jgi:hypothetical protein
MKAAIASLAALGWMISMACAQSPPSSTVDQAAGAVNLGNVLIVQEFMGDGDIGQCNGLDYGRFISPGTSWSPPIRIDTDNRSGGCLYRIGVVDPGNHLRATGFGLLMTFSADGDAGQCGGQGPHQVPIADSLHSLQMTSPIRMDMDDRPGGCIQTWSVTGSRVVLDINFYGDGDVGQCGNVGSHSAPPDVSIRLDTDSRPGGCVQSIRLRRASHGFDEASQLDKLPSIIDAWRNVKN